jgi:hypothetical protein
MRLAVVILFVWCGVVGANPLVLPRPAYIAYERLTVEISPSEARFQGKFVFRFTRTEVVTHKDYASANMAIPVWFPIQSEGDSSMTNLWRLFALEGWNPIRTFQQRQAFEQSVGMTVIVGSKPHHSVGSFLATQGPDERVPQLPPEPGLCRLWCSPEIPSEDIKSGLPVTLRYSQPLCPCPEGGRFYYAPIFLNLSAGVSTGNTNFYSITLTTSMDCAVSVTSGGQKFKLAPGRGVTLSPSHLRPIRALVTREAN